MQTAKDIGEPSVLNRAGGAPTLAVGIARVPQRSAAVGGHGPGTASVFCLKRCSSSPRAGCRYPCGPLHAAEIYR
ncbi:hypothetical protein [Enterobacter chuandaensis]|uniref:hypothetical protein n=1 Tax=Enterobacter chuandaensis TaxID=2497875 RepID=UPI003F68A4DE